MTNLREIERENFGILTLPFETFEKIYDMIDPIDTHFPEKKKKKKKKKKKEKS